MRTSSWCNTYDRLYYMSQAQIRSTAWPSRFLWQREEETNVCCCKSRRHSIPSGRRVWVNRGIKAWEELSESEFRGIKQSFHTQEHQYAIDPLLSHHYCPWHFFESRDCVSNYGSGVRKRVTFTSRWLQSGLLQCLLCVSRMRCQWSED